MKLAQLLLFFLIPICLKGQEGNSEAIFQEAKIHFENGDFEETLRSLDGLNESELAPYFRVKYSLMKGEAYKESYELKKALESIENGLEVYSRDEMKRDTSYLRLLLTRSLLEDDLGAPEKAVESLMSILEESNILPAEHEILPLTYNALAGTIIAFGQYHEAIEYYEKARSLFQSKYRTEYHVDIARVYSNLGNCYKYLFQEDKAEQYYKKAWELFDNIDHVDDYLKAAVAYNTATFFIGKHDAGNALLYDNYCLEIAQQTLKDTPIHAYALNLLAQIYAQLGDYEKAQEAIDLAKPIYDKHQANYLIPTYYYYTNRGGIYSYQKMNKKALIEFHHAASLLEPIEENNPLELANCYGLLGAEYTNVKEYTKARNYLQKAIDLSVPLLGEEDPEVVFYYTDIAFTYIQDGQLEKALAITNNAIETIGFNPESSSPYEQVSEVSTLLRSFADKEEILFKLYQKTNDYDQLEKAKKQASLNLNTLNYLRHNYNNPLTIIGANVKYEELFELSLNVYYEAYQVEPTKENLNLFLNTMEASKSYALLEQLLTTKVKKHAKVSTDILEMESNLKSNLAFWESELAYMETDEELQYAKNEILSSKVSLDSLISIIKEKYPDYTNFKYYVNASTVSEIQSKLKPSQGIVEYFIGTSSIYAIKIMKQKGSILKLPKDPELNEWIESLAASIQYPFVNSVTDKVFNDYKLEYEKLAYLLYQKLVEPLGALPRELTIIPDGFLWDVSFDCLLSKEDATDFDQKSYLAKECIIDYQYALILQNELESKSIALNDWVGFAPQFSGDFIASVRSGYAPLEHNLKEVENILNIVGGKAYTGPNATKEQFLSTVGQYGFYHLATHAVIQQGSNENPYLVFSPDSVNWILSTEDIYKLALPCEMVVLSACNSGQGKLEKGEGMASLSRAFFYAGAKSTIMTQWQVNDQATATIMESFYKELNDGMSKNTALHTAKHDYLENQKNQLLAHPFYWAGFTPIGSMKAVSFDKESNYFWWVAIAGMSLLLILFARRKSKT